MKSLIMPQQKENESSNPSIIRTLSSETLFPGHQMRQDIEHSVRSGISIVTYMLVSTTLKTPTQHWLVTLQILVIRHENKSNSFLQRWCWSAQKYSKAKKMLYACKNQFLRSWSRQQNHVKTNVRVLVKCIEISNGVWRLFSVSLISVNQFLFLIQYIRFGVCRLRVCYGWHNRKQGLVSFGTNQKLLFQWYKHLKNL